MTVGDLEEALVILGTILEGLLGTLSGEVGRQGATLRYAIGDLRTSAPDLLQEGALGAPLWACFEDALAAGADVDDFDLVRTAILAQSPLGLAGIAVANAGLRMALAEQVKALAMTTFSSSQDAFAAITRVNAGFDEAEEFAADHRDPATYQALIAAHAAVTSDLTTRAVSLPALVFYFVPRVLTSHALANRLYGDVGRSDELRAENKIIHPAFMPQRGTALSE